MRSTQRRGTLPLAGAVLVIAGLFFMHGMGTHGAMTHAQMPTVQPHPANGGQVSGGHQVRVSATAAGATPGMVDLHNAALSFLTALPSATIPGTLHAAAEHRGSGGVQTMAMCLTILGVGLLILLAALRARRLTPLAAVMARTIRVAAPKSRRRAPPSLTHLSIQRC